MPWLRCTAALLALLALTAGVAESADRATPARERADEIVLAGGGVSLNQAIAMVERRFRARVVRSEVRQEGNRTVYVLRLLDDRGNAQVVRVDAASGALL